MHDAVRIPDRRGRGHKADPKHDARGVFTEVYRASWPTQIAPVQWSVVASRADVLRGFHVHVRHTDYLMVLEGELVLGLRDIRPESPTYGLAQTITMRPDAATAVTMPPGVAHGFYLPRPSRHLYCVSHYWNVADELGCRCDMIAQFTRSRAALEACP